MIGDRVRILYSWRLDDPEALVKAWAAAVGPEHRGTLHPDDIEDDSEPRYDLMLDELISVRIVAADLLGDAGVLDWETLGSEVERLAPSSGAPPDELDDFARLVLGRVCGSGELGASPAWVRSTVTYAQEQAVDPTLDKLARMGLAERRPGVIVRWVATAAGHEAHEA